MMGRILHRFMQRAGFGAGLAWPVLAAALLLAVFPATAQDASRNTDREQEKAEAARAAAAKGEADVKRPAEFGARDQLTDVDGNPDNEVSDVDVSDDVSDDDVSGDDDTGDDETPARPMGLETVQGEENPIKAKKLEAQKLNVQGEKVQKSGNKQSTNKADKNNSGKNNSGKNQQGKNQQGKSGAESGAISGAELEELEQRAALIGGILLNDLEQTRQLPLFTPVRHPPKPPPPPPPKKKVVKAPPPPPAPPKPPSLRLVGVVLTDDSTLALMLGGDKSVKRVALGDKIDGWSVVKLEPDMVELKLKTERSVYRMFKPGDAAAAPREDDKNARKRRKKKRR